MQTIAQVVTASVLANSSHYSLPQLLGTPTRSRDACHVMQAARLFIPKALSGLPYEKVTMTRNGTGIGMQRGYARISAGAHHFVRN